MNYLDIYFENMALLPNFLIIFAILAFGAIIGSFLNVVILRKESEKNLNGRSHCPQCDYKLTWRDLIPIFSWLALKGKCRKCHQKISVQYPLVELGTALIFLAIFFHVTKLWLSPSATFFAFVWYAFLFSLLVVIFVYDLRNKIIPNRWSYLFALLAFIQTIWHTPFFRASCGAINKEAILNILAGFIFFIPFFCLWYLSKGKWIGLGDGKLALGIGWFLGFVGGLSAIVLSFWIGAVFAISLMLIERLNKGSQNITMKTEIPFGPFMILATIIQFFFSFDVLGISIFFT